MPRRILVALATPLILVLALSAARTIAADPQSSGATPDDAVKLLKAGNERYVSGNLTHPNLGADRRGATAKDGQHPYVTVLTCADSRVPPEFIFDAGLGDLFVVRVAGNVADTDEIGSIEYGVGHLKTPVLLVLGHSKCGAVTAVVKEADVHGSIPKLVAHIKPAVATAKKQTPNAAGDDLINESIRANVWQSIEDTLGHSQEVRELVAKKELKVVGAIYDIETGKINWLGPHPNESKLLAAGESSNDSATADAGSSNATASAAHADEHSHAAATDDHNQSQDTVVAGAVEKRPANSASDAKSADRPQTGATPEQVLDFLKSGNERYAAGDAALPRASASVRSTTAEKGQKPLATVISCSDSRVPVELLFNQGVGDVFVVRVAGNICDTEEIGSAEYGVDHLGTPVMIVLGHTKCGAVTAATTEAEVHGNIPALLRSIKPAVESAKERHPDLTGAALVPAAIEANVWQAIDDAFKFSPTLRKCASEGKVKVVGAIYDIETGKVQWLGEHPQQSKLLGYSTGPKDAPRGGHSASTETDDKGHGS